MGLAAKCNLSRNYGSCFCLSIACLMRRNNAVQDGKSQENEHLRHESLNSLTWDLERNSSVMLKHNGSINSMQLAGIKKQLFWVSWKVIGACLQYFGIVNYINIDLEHTRDRSSEPSDELTNWFFWARWWARSILFEALLLYFTTLLRKNIL